MARRAFRRLFRFPLSEDRVRDDVEHEIDFHVEARTAELAAQGMTPDAARARAVAEFGDVHEARMELETMARRRVRDARRADWWSDLRQDVRYGLRALRRAPLFTLLAVVTLAIGIGANAAVFSVQKSVLIDPLPYRNAGALVRVSMDRPQLGPGPLNAYTIAALAERQESFQRLAAFADIPTSRGRGLRPKPTPAGSGRTRSRRCGSRSARRVPRRSRTGPGWSRSNGGFGPRRSQE
jgi:hypothetical protein